jgi:hypothetical protein
MSQSGIEGRLPARNCAGIDRHRRGLIDIRKRDPRRATTVVRDQQIFLAVSGIDVLDHVDRRIAVSKFADRVTVDLKPISQPRQREAHERRTGVNSDQIRRTVDLVAEVLDNRSAGF